MGGNGYLLYLLLLQLAVIVVGVVALLVCLVRLVYRRDGLRDLRQQKILTPLTLLAAAVLANFAEPISTLPALSWWYEAFNRLQANEVARESMKMADKVSTFYLWIEYRNYDEVTHTVCALLSLVFVVSMAVSLTRTMGYLKRSLVITCGILLTIQVFGYGALL